MLSLQLTMISLNNIIDIGGYRLLPHKQCPDSEATVHHVFSNAVSSRN
jgi:hypothetical protein